MYLFCTLGATPTPGATQIGRAGSHSLSQVARADEVLLRSPNTWSNPAAGRGKSIWLGAKYKRDKGTARWKDTPPLQRHSPGKPPQVAAHN